MSTGICCGIKATGEADEYGDIGRCSECDELVPMTVTKCGLCERTIEPAPFPALCKRCRGAGEEAGRQAVEAQRQVRELERWLTK